MPLMDPARPPIQLKSDMSTLSLQPRIDQLDGYLVESVKNVCSNIIRGQAIPAASRDVSFMLKREFRLSISGGEQFQVIILGKFD